MRIVTNAENQGRVELVADDRLQNGGAGFINRDHVIFASIVQDKLMLVMTFGHQLTVGGSATELKEVVEELTAAAQSNFVQISSGTDYISFS